MFLTMPISLGAPAGVTPITPASGLAGDPAPPARPRALAHHLHHAGPAEAGGILRHSRPGRRPGQPHGQVPGTPAGWLGWLADRPGFFRDEWGVVWNRTIDKDIGVVEDYPLQGRSLAGYTLPDPLDPLRYAGLPAFIAANPRPLSLRQHRLLALRARLELRGMERADGGHARGAGLGR